MPNGYTADIYDGKPITFRDFIFGCARGFGFTIMQRDDPVSAPLITHYEPSTDYYDTLVTKARARLPELQQMTEAEAEQAARDEYEKALASWEESVTRNAAAAQRYDEMISKVEQWKVAAELLEMKQSILHWLREGKEFDCRGLGPPKLKDGPTWRHEALERAERDLEYGLEYRAKEIERTNERNRYLRLLLESLGEPAPAQHA